MASVAGRCPACVSAHPGSSSGIRQSAVQCPARPVSSPSSVQPVQCPARPVSSHLGSSSGCPAIRPSAVHPSGVRPSGVHPSSVQLAGVRPISPQRPSPPLPGGGVSPGRCGGHPSPREQIESPVVCRDVGRFGRRPSRPGPRTGGAAEFAGWSAGASVADPGRVGYGGGAARCATRQARPACRAPRRCGGAVAREGCGARWPRLPRGCRRGWVGDHGGWWSWGRPPGWAGPEGPMGLLAGMGVRPQRGPGWQRVLPARGRQRCDLRDGW
jgi:hypothetical protein